MAEASLTEARRRVEEEPRRRTVVQSSLTPLTPATASASLAEVSSAQQPRLILEVNNDTRLSRTVAVVTPLARSMTA